MDYLCLMISDVLRTPPAAGGAIDSLVGAGLAPSPYEVLRTENEVLRTLLAAALIRLEAEPV